MGGTGTFEETGSGPRLPVAGLGRRGLAYLVDCLFCYLIFAAIHVPLHFLVIRDHLGIAWMKSGTLLEIFTFTTISLPVWIYFAATESSRRQATPGKRIMGVQVTCESKEPLGFGKALVRAAVKLLPWELAHLAVNLPYNPFIDRETGEFLGWEQGEFRWTMSGCYIVMGITLGMCLMDRVRRRALHDRVVGTWVIRARS